MAYNSDIPRLPDPGYNNGIGFTSAAIKPITTGTSSALNGGGQITSLYKGGYWEISVSYPETLQHELETMLPFLDSLEGEYNSFYISLPQYTAPKSGYWDASSSYLIAQGELVLSGDRTIIIPDWAGRGGDLHEGDMLKLTNTDKIYRITGRQYNSSTGEMALTLNTPLKYPGLLPAAGLEPNDILFKVNLKSGSTPGPTLQPNGIYAGFTLTMRENVSGEGTPDNGGVFTWYSRITGLVYCDAYIDCDNEERLPCL